MNFLNWIDVGFIANELLAAIIIFVVLYSLLPFLMKRVDRIWKYIRDDNAGMSIWDAAAPWAFLLAILMFCIWGMNYFDQDARENGIRLICQTGKECDKRTVQAAIYNCEKDADAKAQLTQRRSEKPLVGKQTFLRCITMGKGYEIQKCRYGESQDCIAVPYF